MTCPASEQRWLRVDVNSLARTIVSQTDSAVGDWGAWNSWSDCSTTCDVGFRSRNRICLSSIGNCEGSAEEVEDCTEKFCSEEQGLLSWGEWTYWTRCKPEVRFCYRYRECPYGISDPDFLEACPGKSSQSVPCERDGCGQLQEESLPVVVQANVQQAAPVRVVVATPPPPPKVATVPAPGSEVQQQQPAAPPPPPPPQANFPYQQPYGNRMRYPMYDQVVQPLQTSNNRAGVGGETSVFGIGTVGALALMAYLGNKLIQKCKKKRKRAKERKKGAVRA
ncbi:uncharacterized protein [Diadema antillarum]|uniref:uncharacterized protein n=1 Tax=Diadema antillarum TaxID=105358 RepID=UPI003A89A593